MSNYNNLKTTIDASIKQNNNQEITGSILNSVLNQMVTTLGAGYQFAGVATIATKPGSPDAKVFYMANGKGTYTNFGGVEVTEDDVVVLYWDSSWHKVSTGIASQEKLSELEGKVKSMVGGDLIGHLEDGFYGIDLAFNPNPLFKAAKIDVSSYRHLKLNLSVRDAAYISLVNSDESVLWQTNNAYYLKSINLDNYIDPKFLYISNETSVVANPYVIADDAFDEVKTIVREDVEDVISINLDGFVRQTTGEVSTSTSWKHSQFILINEFRRAYLRGHGSVASIAFYSTDNYASFLGGLQAEVNGWTEFRADSITIPMGAKYLVLSQEVTQQGYYAYGSNVEKIANDVKKNTEAIVSLKSGSYNTRLIHFSFDDIHYCLEDITKNVGVYSSIFDNPFFSRLKTLHDTFGVKFSLFVFASATDSEGNPWSISSVTTSFANEFASCSDWLKFGVHTLGSYGLSKNMILSFAGANSLDTCPRGNGFAGSLAIIEAARDINCGIVGLLGADDTRNSYYLDETKSALLYNRGKYFDPNTQLYFFRTLKRIESQDPSITLAELLDNAGYNLANNAILFTHEYEMYDPTKISTGSYNSQGINESIISKIETCGEWAERYSYVWEYPMNKIRSVF